ncbi:MAG: asparaginase domain-containing protein [Bacteroidota bacterium]
MVQVYVTGGTFDKEYDYLSGGLFFKQTHVPSMLDRGRCTLPINIKTLMMVDSLDMSDLDRQIIAHACRGAETDQIIITHGTDRLVHTAKYLATEVDGLANKTVVLTGAMVPYAFGTSSDGFFNLGSALAFVQCQPPGIYVAMNGRCYNWDRVRKNTKTGYFEEIVKDKEE